MFDPRKIKLNLKPSPKDNRDFKLSPFLFRNVKITSSSDLTVYAGKIRDQGGLGSCTGHGAYAIYDMIHFMIYGTHWDGSPGFVYNMGRILKGCLSEDSGLTIRDILKALAKVGICAESLFPYVEANWYKEPPAEAKADGANHQALAYYPIFGVDMIRTALSIKLPVIIGKTLYASALQEKSLQSGIVTHEPGEAIAGGHCTVIEGHDDSTKMFIEQGSWGTEVGLPQKRGFFQFSYDYAAENISESWIVTKEENNGEAA